MRLARALSQQKELRVKLPPVKNYHNTHWLVGDAVYKVTVCKRLGKKGEIFGLCDQKNKKIKLAAWQGKFVGLETLLHELLHAIEMEYQIHINHDTLDIIAQAMHDLLISNGFIDVQK